MDRRTFLSTLAGGLLAAPLAAEAQPAGKVAAALCARRRLRSSQARFNAFVQGLRDLGLC